MDNTKMIYVAFVLGAVVLAIKLLPLIFLKHKIKNKFLNSFLAYIPYAVLTSMTFPEVFHSTSSIVSASVGAVAAVILSYFGQSLVVVTLSSSAVVFVVEQLMKLIG